MTTEYVKGFMAGADIRIEQNAVDQICAMGYEYDENDYEAGVKDGKTFYSLYCVDFD